MFIMDRMAPLQIKNYLEKQAAESGESVKNLIKTWKDYLNMTYYDLLIGMDLTAFPAYYEPWSYTPLESMAFRIPTITTNLTGFGNWVKSKTKGIEDGIEVIQRNDENQAEAAHLFDEWITRRSSRPSGSTCLRASARRLR